MNERLCPLKFAAAGTLYKFCDKEDCMLYIQASGQCALAQSAILKANQIEREEIRRNIHDRRGY